MNVDAAYPACIAYLLEALRQGVDASRFVTNPSCIVGFRKVGHPSAATLWTLERGCIFFLAHERNLVRIGK